MDISFTFFFYVAPFLPYPLDENVSKFEDVQGLGVCYGLFQGLILRKIGEITGVTQKGCIVEVGKQKESEDLQDQK